MGNETFICDYEVGFHLKNAWDHLYIKKIRFHD